MNLLQNIQAQRRNDSQTITEACVFATQAVLATLAVEGLYRLAGSRNAMWAAISAVLVLQPGFQRSLAASAIRVAANLIGAGLGMLVSLAVAEQMIAACVALALTIVVCSLLRLDTGVRSACASVLIVTLAPGASVLERGIDRAAAVFLGCAVALALQLALQGFLRRFERQ